MLICTDVMLEAMLERFRDFIRENPEAQLFQDWPYPAKEFSASITKHETEGIDCITIYHPARGRVYVV